MNCLRLAPAALLAILAGWSLPYATLSAQEADEGTPVMIIKGKEAHQLMQRLQELREEGPLGPDRLTEGSWRYVTADGNSAAIFSDTGLDRFKITCQGPSNQISLVKLGVIAAEGTTMRVVLADQDRDLPIITPDRSVSETIAELDGDDPLVDDLMRKGDHVNVFLGYRWLNLPITDDVTRVIEDCQ